MHCPHCGASFPDGARFCRNCGTPLVGDQPTNQPAQNGGPVYQAPNASRVGPRPPEGYYPELGAGTPADTYAGPNTHAAPTPNGTPRAKSARSNAGILVAVIALVALLVVVLSIFGFASCAAASAHNTAGVGHTHGTALAQKATMHPVTFTVNIADDSYDTSSSRFPVRITGTDANGDKVDKTIFLAYSGTDVELLDGEYEVEALGSAISSNGTIYQYPTDKASFTIDKYVGENEEYTVSSSHVLSYYPIAPQNMTDELVNDAIAWARKDEESGADVGTLEKAIEKRRSEASSTTDSSSSSTSSTDSAAQPEANSSAQSSAQPEAKPEDKPDKGIG